MNGPFHIREDEPRVVRDVDGGEVCHCYYDDGPDQARMICNAINAVYYAQQAAKATPQGAADHGR